MVTAVTLAPWAVVALTRTERLQSIESALRSTPDTGAIWFLLGGACAVMLLLLVLRRFMDRERRVPPPPKRDLFHEALDLLPLSGDERRLLRLVAQRARAVEPLALLLSPQALTAATARLTPDAAEPQLRRRVSDVSVRLFGEPLDLPLD